MIRPYTPEEAAAAHRLWAAGRCPCCGAHEFDNWIDDGTEPIEIAPGIRICAWCVHREHDADDVAPVLLQMITQGAPKNPEEPPMPWVRHTEPTAIHRCPTPRSSSYGTPTGEYGDLWRCDECQTLWRIGHACELCEVYGAARPHLGGHAMGFEWRPARWWQRLRHWRKGRR
ncbi:hypothetical protein [Sphaerisporangium aureirubrum]|uniref:Uncharacterized protein n=1 Tax=Sphaerisporangium aureirubrum TaxID=1544736 RepID=A0ABW1ND32_9ACTN